MSCNCGNHRPTYRHVHRHTHNHSCNCHHQSRNVVTRRRVVCHTGCGCHCHCHCHGHHHRTKVTTIIREECCRPDSYALVMDLTRPSRPSSFAYSRIC